MVRVRDLSVAVERSNEVASDDAVRGALEAGFLRALLGSCETTMLERLGLPDGVAFVRSVDVQWSIDEHAVFDEPRARELGRELGVAVAARCQRVEPGIRAVSSHSVVFASHADYRAFCIHAESTSSVPWFAKTMSRAQMWSDVAAVGDSAVTELLVAIARWDILDAAFEGLTPTRIKELARAASRGAVPADVVNALSTLQSTDATAAAARAHATTAAADATSERTPSTPASPVAGDGTREGLEPDRRSHRRGAYRADEPSVPHELPSATPNAPLMRSAGDETQSPLVTGRADMRDATDAVDESARVSLQTAWGGVAYLLGPALELELGEHLWCAGLSEPFIFDAVVRLLLPAGLPNVDAAPRILSGLVVSGDQSVEAADWVAEEIASKTLKSLATAFERRELPGDSRVAFATTRAELLARTATPVSSVVADCAAAVVALFQMRIGREEVGSARLHARLAKSATVRISAEELVVSLSMDSIDIDVRRAGLDFDPGWVPWMRRRALITYDDGDSPRA